ncbi:MAG: HYR domain-containing protein [Ferruginibacter sp.]
MKKILLQNIHLRLATSALLLFTILPAVSKGQCPGPTISTNWISSATFVRFCEGQTVDFTAIPGNPGPGISYLWSTGDTTQTISVGVSGDLYVTTTDQNGCSATSDYWYVGVEPTPEIGGIYSVPPDCSGTNGFIAISATEPNNTSGYTIDGFATVSSGSDFSGLGPGTYLIGIQSFRGCRSEITSFTLDAPAYSEVQIVCQPDLEVNADQGANSADVVVDPPSASGGCGELTVTSSHPGSSFLVGTTIIAWTASDPYGGTATCQQSVTVLGQIAPEFTCRPDTIVATSPRICTAPVQGINPVLSPSGSLASINYTLAGATISTGTGTASGSTFNKGVTTVTYSLANDASVTCSFTVTVRDNEPPVITNPLAHPDMLWPPNHQMKDVEIHYELSDNCGATAVLSVTSNEPQSGTEAGDVSGDWQIINEHYIKLRAERKGNGTGRIYTITIIATDAAGNKSSKQVFVKVPHNGPGTQEISIKAFPNPTTNEFYLSSPDKTLERVTIKVMNSFGRIIETFSKVSLSNVVKFGANYPPGIYVVEIFNNSFSRKLILTKLSVNRGGH